jgi:hypothetical protein
MVQLRSDELRGDAAALVTRFHRVRRAGAIHVFTAQLVTGILVAATLVTGNLVTAMLVTW